MKFENTEIRTIHEPFAVQMNKELVAGKDKQKMTPSACIQYREILGLGELLYVLISNHQMFYFILLLLQC